MNNDNIRITYPDSEKVYMQGSLHPDMKVGMRKVSLTPTVTRLHLRHQRTVQRPVCGH